MESKFVNFFKYLEDKGEQRTPLRIKLLNPKQFEIVPEDLNVKDNLYLINTPIPSLPDGLKVGGNLDLNNIPITSLPKDLKFEVKLSWRRSKKFNCKNFRRK